MKSNIAPALRGDDEFPALLDVVRDHFARAEGPFFTTDAKDLYEDFLAALTADLRQTYTCHACRRFFETYGGLVTISPSGVASPAMWPSLGAPEPFGDAVMDVANSVRRAKVTGVFLSSESVWGQPVTGYWHHLAVEPPAAYVYRATPLKNAAQAMAEKSEEREMLLRGLMAYPRHVVAAALPLLESEALYRSEKCLGVARWLLALHDAREATKREDLRENVVWRAVAMAPPGWAHVRSTMIGTLLDDVAAGMDFATVSRRFAEKMHPLRYLRPQAAPSAGVLAQAERAVAALGSAGSLRRRFARLDDVVALWRPAPPVSTAPSTGSVFGHLRPKDAAPAVRRPEPPPLTVTWEKFSRIALPGAERIECLVPNVGPFVALVTAEDPGAPPILQWDTAERRCPVSGYLYHGGSFAHRWGLPAGAWVDVTAVTLLPHMWHGADRFAQHGRGALFLLDGARDSEHEGLAIFPDTLRSEYHDIRSAIEAYSRSGTLSGADEASACGITYRGQTVRVTSATGRLVYHIDRWD